MYRFKFCSSILVPALAALLLSCSSTPEPDKLLRGFASPLPEIFRNDSTVFRGVQLGMNLQEVKARCNAKTLTLDDGSSLLYEDSLKGKTSFTFEFRFDSLGLNEIQVDIYQREKPDGDSLVLNIRRYLTGLYGAADEQKDQLSWTPDRQKRSTTIKLLDESAEYGYGKVSLSIYDKAMVDDPFFIPAGEQDSAQDSLIVF